MHDCLVSFGSNLGDSRKTLIETAKLLGQNTALDDLVVSPLIESEPVGGPEGQPRYVNAVFRFNTSLDVKDLHRLTMDVEQQLGRQRRVRWGSRTVDLDVLLYGESSYESENLVVPHPRMSFRRFVIEPASTIAGDMRHPISNQTIEELLAVLDLRANLIVVVGAMSPETLVAIDEGHGTGAVRIWQAGPFREPAEPNHWVIRNVSSLSELAEFSLQAKLVVALGENARLDGRTSPLSGPILRLHDTDSAHVATEILASIQAMNPMQ